MHWGVIVLAATDTPATLKALLSATTKYRNVTRIVIYPESENNAGATGPARIGGPAAANVARAAAAADRKGIPLVPGIKDADTFPYCGGGVYHLDLLYLTGETGDVFQVGWTTN